MKTAPRLWQLDFVKITPISPLTGVVSLVPHLFVPNASFGAAAIIFAAKVVTGGFYCARASIRFFGPSVKPCSRFGAGCCRGSLKKPAFASRAICTGR
jgi:hypothetical protein